VSDAITTRILPATPDDIERNVVRVEVTAPRHRGFVVTQAPEQDTDVTVVNDVNVIAPQGGHTINYATNPGLIRATDIRLGSISADTIGDNSITAAGGWCAPSSTVYELAGQMDYNEVAQQAEFTVPRGMSITWESGAVTPEALRLMWGQPPYAQEETLL
jgi:hypothetical protein